MSSSTSSIRIEFFGRDRTMGKTFDAQWRKADTLAKKLDLMSKRMTAVGRRMTMGVTLPIVAGFAAATRASMRFEDAMVKSTAIMGDLSAETRQQMEETARTVATSTKFSATEAAESYFFLASAGLDAAQSIKALPQVAKFAQAGNFDMARATDLLTDAQTALGLSSKNAQKNLLNMARVSDVIVKANVLANASTEQFSEALTNKGAAALKLLNKDMEEGVALLAAWAAQGVKGEQAGEYLSMALRDLQRASLKQPKAWKDLGIAVYDSSGKMRNTADIIGDLEDAFGSMSDKQKRVALTQLGFQDRSVAVVQSLLGQSEAIKQYERDLRKAGGTTNDVAKKQMKSMAAQLGLLKDKFTDVGITIGQVLIPYVGRAGEWVGKLADDFAGLSKGQTTFIVGLAALTAAIGPVLWMLGKMGTGVLLVSTRIATLARTVGVLTAAFRLGGVAAFSSTLMASLGPIGLVTAGLVAAGGLVYALHKLDQAMDESIATAEDYDRVMAALGGEGAEQLQRQMDAALGRHFVVRDGKLEWAPEVTFSADDLKDAVVKGIKAAGVAERKAMKEEALLTQIAAAEIAVDKARAAMDAEDEGGGKGAVGRRSPEFLAAQQEFNQSMAWLEELSSKRDDLQARFKPIEVQAEISDLRRGIRESEAELERLAKLPPAKRTAEVLLKEEKLRKGINRSRRSINDLTSKNWKVLIEAKIEKEQKKLDNMEDALETLNKKKSTPKVEADKQKLERAIKDSKERLEKLAKQKTSPKIEVTDEATEKARRIRQGLVTMYELPITQTIRVVKTGQDLPQAYGGSYLLNHATSFIAGEAGREVAAFFPLNDPSRSRAIFAQLTSQLGSILPVTRSMPVPTRTHAAAAPQAVAGGAGGMNVRLDVVFPGTTALVGEAKSVARTLAPYIAQELGITLKQRARRHP